MGPRTSFLHLRGHHTAVGRESHAAGAFRCALAGVLKTQHAAIRVCESQQRENESHLSVHMDIPYIVSLMVLFLCGLNVTLCAIAFPQAAIAVKMRVW